MSTDFSVSCQNATIYVAGHRGLVGSAICRALEQRGCSSLLTRTHAELDLTDQAAVHRFFADNRPAYVFLAAAKVGGIHANDSSPADFIRDNLLIQTNIIDAAFRCGTSKLLFLGSSCIYPKFAPQPMKEEHLLTGELEPTNEWYAVAKIAGIKMCQAYWKQHGFKAISLMPTNLYGPGDNFDLQTSHVLPALIRKFHEAKSNALPEVEIWGTGTPKREFLHVDDLAAACLFLMEQYDEPVLVHCGSGNRVGALFALAGVGLVMLVHMLEQPWRGIVDAGVVTGLMLGVTSIIYYLIQSFIKPELLKFRQTFQVSQ